MLQPAKNPFIDTLTVVIEDVKWFLFLLVLTLWGFACAFYILFRHDQQHEVIGPPTLAIMALALHATTSFWAVPLSAPSTSSSAMTSSMR